MALSSMKLSLVQAPSPENNHVKVAFATSDNESINQHFGSTKQFSIYSLGFDGWQLVELIEFTQTPTGHSEDKLTLRVNALTECSSVYCNVIGMSAIKKLLALKIKPMNVEAGTDIKSTLSALQLAWQNNPDYWSKNSTKSKMSAAAGATNSTGSERLTDLLNEEWEL